MMDSAFPQGLSLDMPVGVHLGQSATALSAIQQPDCAAAIWARPERPGFQSWIDALEPRHLPSARIILRPEDVRHAVGHLCDAAGTPDCAERAQIIDDITSLANMFTELTRPHWLRLRLDIVTTNACRKFHTDAVTARLVCTYRGTGTQYGTTEQGTDPAHIFTAPTGSPIVLRGTLWPEQPLSGFRHRSPPIEGSGETRLVLVLDPITSPEDEA